MKQARIQLQRMNPPVGERLEDQPYRSSSMPGFHLFSALCERAQTLVVENYYFDLDTRSEVGELQETRFGVMAPYTSRFHFFVDKAEPGEHLRDFVKRAATHYLGYSVIRTQLTGRLGRSIVPTLATVYDDRGGRVLRPEVVHRQVRTAVVENLNLFGVELAASGVPFMEQDGSLLRCAHVSSWICHYSAVLRFEVPRRTTAHFHRTGDSHRALGRRYPSIGLSVEEMSSMLRRSDMPPERLDRDSLREGRVPAWSDLNELHEADEMFGVRSVQCVTEQGRLDALQAEFDKLEAAGEAVPTEALEALGTDREQNRKAVEQLSEEVDGFWIRENLVASICRYLNSGVPLILIRLEQSHTQVVVGYLRNRDVDEAADLEASDASRVVQLIVTDDVEGPFRIVTVDEIVQEILDNLTEVLVPLPHSLWMPGAVAEKIAIKLVAQAAALRLERLDGWGEVIKPSQEYNNYKTVLDDLNIHFDERSKTDKYAMHVFSTTGVSLKRSVAGRLDHMPDFVRSLASLQLPKYVWVGEVMDRGVHEVPSVVGMIVLDASQPWAPYLDGPEGIEVLPLFVHIPGHIQMTPYGYGFAGVPKAEPTDSRDEGYWAKATFEPYSTGRWGPERLAEQTAGSQAGQAKIAIVTD